MKQAAVQLETTDAAEFETQVRMRRSHVPDSALGDAAETREIQGRIERIVERLKTRALRGDNAAADQLIVLKANLYDVFAEAQAEGGL